MILQDPNGVSEIRQKAARYSNRLEQLFDTIGDGSGSTDMAAASNIYKVSPPVGERFLISAINVNIEDDSKFRGDRYGGTASLVNGIDITIQNSTGSVLRFTQLPIKRIGHWHLICGAGMHLTDFSSGNDHMSVGWEFNDSGGPVEIDGNKGEYIQISTGDDMSDLVSHYIQAQGIRQNI